MSIMYLNELGIDVTAEVEAFKLDAKRFQWLKKFSMFDGPIDGEGWCSVDFLSHGETMEKAIDNAMGVKND